MPDPVPAWLLLGSAFALGLRHGIDWDHISAIMDITSTQKDLRHGVVLGWLYAGGHGTVVGVLGVLAVLIGLRLPPGVDTFMAYFVGLTLVVLAVYVLNMLFRHPEKDFRIRSRWVLLASGVAALWDRLAARVRGRPVKARDVNLKVYGPLSAYVIGIVHGIGGETPTQILIFLLAAGVGATALGLPVVLVFIAGVFITNTIESVLSAMGYAATADRPRLYRRLATAAAAFSLVIGVIFLAGASGMLPTLG